MDHASKVRTYYRKLESRFGYRLLLGGVRHFGYFPKGQESISYAQAQRNMEDKLAQALSLPKGASVLDAGCGEGAVSLYLAQEHGLAVTGIDLLPESIGMARANAAKMECKKVKYEVADYSHMRFEEGSFDGVYTMETLTHSPDYKITLSEFKRVLRPGGRLVMHEYFIEPDWEKVEAKEKKLVEDLMYNKMGMTSLRHFKRKAFEESMREIGFTNITFSDVSEGVRPMLKRFARSARFVYPVAKTIGLRDSFLNAMWSVHMQDAFERYGNVASYQIVAADVS